MLITNIFLVLISGIGVLHGFLIAIYLLVSKKRLVVPNKLLSLLLFVLSFRIGKSVILEFCGNIYLTLIFIGLASLFLIGPLFYLYTQSLLDKSFGLKKNIILHFAPFLPAIIFALIINQEFITHTPSWVFILMFCLYYGHYLFYLCRSYLYISRAKQSQGNIPDIQWLYILFYGLAAIWIVYVLNIVEDKIPYIIGPILYSIIAYGVTFLAMKNGYVNQPAQFKYNTTPLNDTDTEQIFDNVKKLLEENELYKDADLSLNTLSRQLKVSNQKISMAINVKYKSNFNTFINNYRIKHSCVLLKKENYQHYTIAFIAYESGFSSLSSFNSAFKNATGKTPSAYRKETTKNSS